MRNFKPKYAALLFVAGLLFFGFGISMGNNNTARALVADCPAPASALIGDPIERANALKVINDARNAMNVNQPGPAVPTLTEDVNFSAGAQKHAYYVYANSDTGIDASVEVTSNPCYTAEGSTSAQRSIVVAPNTITPTARPLLVSTNIRNGQQAVLRVLDSVFARAKILNPRLNTIGIGLFPGSQRGVPSAADFDTYSDFATNGTNRTVFQPVVYPADKQTGVPVSMIPFEFPDPRRAGLNSLTGYPISIIFDPTQVADISRITLFEPNFADPTGVNTVPFVEFYPQDPTITGYQDAVGNILTIVPRDPLRANTTYTVQMSGNVNGQRYDRTWSFTTGNYYADNSPIPNKIPNAVVISQVSGGTRYTIAANGEATPVQPQTDFIELFNPSYTPIVLGGASIQYASANSNNWAPIALPNITLQPGQYFLIQMGASAPAGATPDLVALIEMGALSGKVALVRGTSALNCPGSPCQTDYVNSPGSRIIDFVGYGNGGSDQIVTSNSITVPVGTQPPASFTRTTPDSANITVSVQYVNRIGQGNGIEQVTVVTTTTTTVIPANTYEGSGATGTPSLAFSSTQSVTRLGNGCTDTNDNIRDFSVGAPTPRNTASTRNRCPLLTIANPDNIPFPSALPTPGPNTGTIAQCPPPTDIALADEAGRVEGLAQLNTIRSIIGVPLVTEDKNLSRGAQQHAYYAYASSTITPAIDLSIEARSSPCFTEGGAAAARNSIVVAPTALTTTNRLMISSNGIVSALDTVNRILNSIYPRARMLNPRLQQVGIGVYPGTRSGSRSAGVLDTESAPKSNTVFAPVTYPADGQRLVPTSMLPGEIPDPIARFGLTYPTGFAITVIFDPTQRADITNITLTGPNKTEVQFVQILPNAPVTSSDAVSNVLAIIPVKPLSPNTTYTVTVTGVVGGSNYSKTWSFVTGGDPGPNGTPLPTPTQSGPILLPSTTPFPTATPTPGFPVFPPNAPTAGPSNFFTPQPADTTNPLFYRLWVRTDDPVKAGRANRSWIYGDQPYGFSTLIESYNNGFRLVNYHDKARIEAFNASSTSTTNGLLVREMILGQAQVGDSAFIPRSPAQIAIAGDAADTNINAPTYATFAGVASLNNDRRVPNQVGQTVVATINRQGTIGVNPGTGTFNVTNVYYDNTLGHNIPNVFWDYMNQTGIVNNNGNYVNEKVVDWLSTFGLPLSEAYWTRAIVGGVEKDVLVQVFERRVLTYTPSNPDPFKTEMGNVGRHYYKWRYNIG